MTTPEVGWTRENLRIGVKVGYPLKLDVRGIETVRAMFAELDMRKAQNTLDADSVAAFAAERDTALERIRELEQKVRGLRIAEYRRAQAQDPERRRQIVKGMSDEIDRLRARTHEIQAQEMKKRADMDSDLACWRNRWERAKQWTEDVRLTEDGPYHPFWSFTSDNMRSTLFRLVTERDEAREQLAEAQTQIAKLTAPGADCAACELGGRTLYINDNCPQHGETDGESDV